MTDSSPPSRTSTAAGKRAPSWVGLVSLFALGVACYAGLSLPGLAIAAIGRIGPVSEVSATIGAPKLPPLSRGSVDRDNPQTTARLADGQRIILGPASAVPLAPGTDIRLTYSDWTGHPVRVASSTQRIELLPRQFGPPTSTIPAQAATFALLVLVWRRNGPGYGMIVVFGLAIGCMIGQFTVSRDATPRADGPVAVSSVPGWIHDTP